MAEAVFKEMLKKEGLEHQVSVDSAATGTWNLGQEPHYGTKKRLAKAGISTEGLLSRLIADSDLSADYIIGMDDSNIENIHHFIAGRPSGQVVKLLQFSGENRGIADPYYTGDFEATFRDVTKGCQALIEQIKKEL